MDGLGDYHTKWSKSGQERKIAYDLTYMKDLKKMIQMSWSTTQRLTDLENKIIVTRGKGRGERENGSWDWHVHIAVLKTDEQQGPTL